MYWNYKGKNVKSLDDVPKSSIGFIYELVDSNGVSYIGRKSFKSIRNVKTSKKRYLELKKQGKQVKKTKNKKKSKKGKPVWIYKRKVEKETNWLNYNGSSKELKKELKKGLKLTKKNIIKYCYNKKQMTYYELKYQICSGVLENPSLFWNKNILGKFFSKDIT